MDYRRREGFIRPSSSSRHRDPYENVGRVGASNRLIQRSLSPQAMPQDVGAASQRTGSVERTDYGWNSDRGRAGRVRSRSPPAVLHGDARKRSHYDNGVGILPGNYSPTPLPELRPRRGEMGEAKNLGFKNNDSDFHAMRAYRYDPSDPRTSKEEFNEHQSLGQDIVPAKVLGQGSYRSPTHFGPTATLVYSATGGKLPPKSRAMDTQQHFEQGRVQYQDAMVSNRLPGTHSYQDGEKRMFQTKDGEYQGMPGSNSRVVFSSSEMSRHEYLAYHDSLYLPQPNGLNSSKFSEPATLSVYRASHLDSVRDHEGSQRDASFRLSEYSPNNGEHENYFYQKSHEIGDDRGYPADDMREVVTASRAHQEYGRTQIIYDHRDMSRPTTHSVIDKNDIDGFSGNLRRGITLYHPAVEKQTDPDYIDMRTPRASKQGGEYLDSRFSQVEISRTIPEDHDLPHVGTSKGHRLSDLEADYVFENDLDQQLQEERSLQSPASKYGTALTRHNVRTQNMRDERRIYKPQDRVARGKYSIKEATSTYYPRKNFPEKMYLTNQFEEFYEPEEEWIDEEMNDLYTSRMRGYQQPRIRTERKYNELEDREDFVYERLSSLELQHARKHSVGIQKPYSRHIKGNRRPSYTSHHSLKQHDRKDNLYRQRNSYDRRNQLYRQHNHYDKNNHAYRHHKIWIRNEGYYEDTLADDGTNDSDPSEDWVGPKESVLVEDSEEFQKLVHEAFFKYSRMLNVNSSVRRRYTEEGKAGSLFCIVCGRSASKEFMDTQRLVTHAFMSHKTGLRADHLGLHKAICVLLGWNTVIPDETITWVPQVLSQAQALSQKEDLILWPPVVVIHNISLSDRNPEKWKVITMEALETFIRGKGFIRGRIKVVLGKPADQSVMVVKFLGTFTGLGDAEKLHKYFIEGKRGRIDLDLATSNGGEISFNGEAQTAEENILYGYLGISEDLDRVDYNTRNSGLVKSKNDILDLANAPVKNEET